MSDTGKYAFPGKNSTLLIYVPHNYGSHPSKFVRLLDEIKTDLTAANPGKELPSDEYATVEVFGGMVRKRIKGVEWSIPTEYTIPEGWSTWEGGPGGDFNHL